MVSEPGHGLSVDMCLAGWPPICVVRVYYKDITIGVGPKLVEQCLQVSKSISNTWHPARRLSTGSTARIVPVQLLLACQKQVCLLNLFLTQQCQIASWESPGCLHDTIHSAHMLHKVPSSVEKAAGSRLNVCLSMLHSMQGSPSMQQKRSGSQLVVYAA